MMKREQHHFVRSLPKKPSGSKHIVCHHCSAFGHLRPHCSKFEALKRIKRKGKLELLGSCAKKARKLNWIGLKMVSCWSMWLMLLPPCQCASPILTLPTLVSLLMTHSKKSFRLDEEGFLWLSFCSFSPWSNSFNLCRTPHAFDAALSCIYASCISLYALFLFLLLILHYCFVLVWVKIQKHIKSEIFQKVW